MKMLRWNTLGPDERAEGLARPAGRGDPALKAAVAEIIASVEQRGWDAVVEIAVRIDGAEPRSVLVAKGAAQARAMLSAEQLAAFELAASNIAAFHGAAVPAAIESEPMPGLRVRKLWRAIDRVGLYVPGGATPLFSTLMMLALPARAAGVGELVVVTPPRADGGLDPLIALAAERCGIEAVFTLGGAQAIAALVAELVKDGLVSWIKYAIVCTDPTKDAVLSELVDRVDPQMIVSGIGEQPALVHLDQFKMGGFTTGCGCLAPVLSQKVLAVKRSNADGRKD